MRLRTLLIGLGALLVAAVFSFPLWFGLIQPDQTPDDVVFPGLPRDLEGLFLVLPADQQAVYRAVSEQDRGRGLAMVVAALSPRAAAPEDERDPPEMTSPVTAAVGTFQRVDAVRWGQGDVTIYQQSGANAIVRLENFSVANAPDLHIILSTSLEPQLATDSLTESTDIDLGVLKGTYGNQHYELPAGTDIREYSSVILYSVSLELVYSVAPLFLRI